MHQYMEFRELQLQLKLACVLNVISNNAHIHSAHLQRKSITFCVTWSFRSLFLYSFLVFPSTANTIFDEKFLHGLFVSFWLLIFRLIDRRHFDDLTKILDIYPFYLICIAFFFSPVHPFALHFFLRTRRIRRIFLRIFKFSFHQINRHDVAVFVVVVLVERILAAKLRTSHSQAHSLDDGKPDRYICKMRMINKIKSEII